jgi:hypothetical protein
MCALRCRSQIDKEIEDVSDTEVDDDAMARAAAMSGLPASAGELAAAAAAAAAGLSGVRGAAAMAAGGGLSGGAGLGGGNKPLVTTGPKDHTYEVVDGEARARVYDTPVGVTSLPWGHVVHIPVHS